MPTILVTGASRGIGRAVALALGRRGATVAVHYGSRSDAAARVVAEVDAAGGSAFAAAADLAQPEAPAQLIARVRDELRARGDEPVLQGLVSNAGAVVPGGLGNVRAADFDRAVALGARAPLLLIQAAIPLLRPGSRIVTVSAAITRFASPEMVAQSAAKAALQNLVLQLAAPLGELGVGIVDVAPGVVRTDLAAALLATPGAEDDVAGATALRRVGESEDIADAVVALLAPEARWITGRSIDVSGGYRL